MKPINVAFIDDGIHKKWLYPNPPHIQNAVVVHKKEDYGEDFINEQSHVDRCFRIFTKFLNRPCNVFFYQALSQAHKNANIDDLINALVWCAENGIQLINLSLGTTNFYDAPKLQPVIQKLFAKNIVVAAACSNGYQMTFPACFDEVIGVRGGLPHSANGFIYLENPLDKIDVHCSLRADTLEEEEGDATGHVTAHSLLTPYVTAAVCNAMNDSINTNAAVRNWLNKNSLQAETRDQKWLDIRQRPETDAPRIAVCINSIDEGGSPKLLAFIQEILLLFRNDGYAGVCINRFYKTDFDIGIIHSNRDSPLDELIWFYSRYIRTSLLLFIIESSQEHCQSLFDVVLYYKAIPAGIAFEQSIELEHYDQETGTYAYRELCSLLCT